MTELIWYGRGGQGAFTAAKLLGAAYSLKGSGNYSLAFPSFGPERRGVLVRAFTKLDMNPILDRSETEKADYIIILNETLYSDSLKNLLKPNGKIIINTKQKMSSNVYSFDGNSISDSLCLPTVNTVMLGAISAVSELLQPTTCMKLSKHICPKRYRGKINRW